MDSTRRAASQAASSARSARIVAMTANAQTMTRSVEHDAGSRQQSSRPQPTGIGRPAPALGRFRTAVHQRIAVGQASKDCNGPSSRR
jgi:hypothetical protein